MTDDESIAVIGAGRMGHGIALMFALGGHEVRITDADPETLESVPERMGAVLEQLTAADRIDEAAGEQARNNVRTVPTISDAVSGVDFVTEAVAEDLEIKQAVFEQLSEHAPRSATLATNTSGLSIDDIAGPVASPERVLGTHWFNPPYLVPLVEVIYGSETSDSVVEGTRDRLDAIGKTPVVVKKDIPGFIGNRIQAAMSYEAFSLLAKGVASPADIDKAVKAGFGFRLPIMGIFEKMDQSGLAIHHEVEKQLLGELDRGTDPNPVIEELLAEGHTGTDSGKGIYDWSAVDLDAMTRERDQALLAMLELYEAAGAESSPPANYDRS